MKSLWDNKGAKKIKPLSLKMRVYTSHLLGQEEDLVLHGGGNTSVKLTEKGRLGQEEVLYIKGSGWDLATIKEEGFPELDKRFDVSFMNLLSKLGIFPPRKIT